MATPTSYTVDDLPGLDCGVCGMRSCEELAARLPDSPELIKRCIYLSDNRYEARNEDCHRDTEQIRCRIWLWQHPVPTCECSTCDGILRCVRSSFWRSDFFYSRHEQSVS